MANVAQRAYRILRALDLYSPVVPGDPQIPEAVRKSGRILGVYNRLDDRPERTLWLTDDEIWTFADCWQPLKYAQMTSVEYPVDKSGDEDFLVVVLEDGSAHRIHVAGRKGRLRDVYEVGRFLDRAVSDVKTKAAVPRA